MLKRMDSWANRGSVCSPSYSVYSVLPPICVPWWYWLSSSLPPDMIIVIDSSRSIHTCSSLSFSRRSSIRWRVPLLLEPGRRPLIFDYSRCSVFNGSASVSVWYLCSSVVWKMPIRFVHSTEHFRVTLAESIISNGIALPSQHQSTLINGFLFDHSNMTCVSLSNMIGCNSCRLTPIDAYDWDQKRGLSHKTIEC
jgi:hypothetical protein